MNTNDLPPAAKLAALIEAGRAANPDLEHGKGAYLHQGAACAIGFAVLGTGVPRASIQKVDFGKGTFEGFVAQVGIPDAWECRRRLTDAVVIANDNGMPLDEIILSLREGELAKVTA